MRKPWGRPRWSVETVANEKFAARGRAHAERIVALLLTRGVEAWIVESYRFPWVKGKTTPRKPAKEQP